MQWYMSYRFADSLRAGSGRNQFRPDPARKLSANLFDIYHCCVQWKTPDDGQRNCPKHVEFYSKNKYEKLVHLVGFIIRTFCIISLFSTKSCLFHYFIFVCSNNKFSINHLLKLEHPTRKDEGYPKNRKDWHVRCRQYKTCFILLY